MLLKGNNTEHLRLIINMKENTTPSNIGGMGEILLPTQTQDGSGDIPSGQGDADKKNKKKKKMATLKTFKAFTESIITEKFNFSEKEVRAAAEALAKAMAKLDDVHVGVHDFEYDKGRGAGFELSWGGEDFDGGSYYIKDNGDVINAAVGGGTKYGNIKDTEKTFMKGIKKAEPREPRNESKLSIEELNESFESYYFHKDAFRGYTTISKGETQYAVITHNKITLNKQNMTLKDENDYSIGAAFKPKAVSVFKEESDAKTEYDKAVKKGGSGANLSFSYGTITNAGANTSYVQIEGMMAALKY